MHRDQIEVELSRRQKLSRVNRLAIAPDLKVQSRLAFRPLSHRRDLLALVYCLSFIDQQRLVVPVGTEIGVVMFKDNKLPVPDQSTPGVHDASGSRGVYGLAGAPIDQHTRTRTRFSAESDAYPTARRPPP